jgi:signal transduction histidine kinase/CheY-like chemotaxis protein
MKQGGNVAAAELGERAEIILNELFDFYGTLDTSGRVLDIKGRIFTSTGIDPSLLSGQPFAHTVFWQSSPETPSRIERAISETAGGPPARLRLEFRVSSDEKAPVELALNRISDGAGGWQIFVSGQDLEKRADFELGDQKRTLQLLAAAENSEIGIWFWDFRTGSICATQTCNELFELPPDVEIAYDSFRSVIHPEDREAVDDTLHRARFEGTKYQIEFRVVHSDGSTQWISAEGRCFLDSAGQPLQMMGIVRRVTEAKAAAEELARVYDRERAARDEAVEANRAKDFFLAFVSHELRSPLNAILGWAKILLTKEVNEETRLNALQTIERSARFQTKLIDDLVDSARVASGKLRLEYRTVNLVDVVKLSFDAQKPAAAAQDLHFEFSAPEEPVHVFADSGRLQQVFSNLLSNAIKFTPPGGTVEVSVRPVGEHVTVTVRDTGRGISSAALPDIFRQFSQGDVNQTRNNVGLGLGLSIVKILVGKHSGTVEASSEGEGKGSTFTVTLPVAAAERGTVAPDAARPSVRPLERIRVLVVEDDADSREVIHLFLEQSGADVVTADSAEAAFRLIGSPAIPDVMVSDLAMPDEDGYSLVSRIRGLPAERGGAIPALALSAFATADSKQRAFDAGFQKYLTKPFEPESLLKEILELAGRKPRG